MMRPHFAPASRRTVHAAAAASFAALLGGHAATAAPILDQIDTFQDGTTMNWLHGIASQNQPTNVATGGPAGAGDRYARAVSTNSTGADGKALILNQSARWTGAFPSTIKGIDVDLLNSGATPLSMRVAFRTGASDQFSSITPFPLPADGLWHHAHFDLTDAAMQNLFFSGTTVAAGLQDVIDFRIVHSTTPSFIAGQTVATFGIDNVRAVGAPEPGTIGVAVIAATAGLARRRRRPR